MKIFKELAIKKSNFCPRENLQTLVLGRLNYAVEVTEYSVKFSRLKHSVKCTEITEIIKILKIH